MLGRIKPVYFIGGMLGMAFVTANIILMPFRCCAYNDCRNARPNDYGNYNRPFWFNGLSKNKITARKVCGLICIAIGIILLRLF